MSSLLSIFLALSSMLGVQSGSNGPSAMTQRNAALSGGGPVGRTADSGGGPVGKINVSGGGPVGKSKKSGGGPVGK